MKQFLSGILDEISPDLEETKGLKRVCEMVSEVAGKLKKEYEYEPMLCGSIAKDTWLSEKKDVDLFLLFDKKLGKKELEKRGLEAARKIINKLNGECGVAYAEHPYIQGEVNGYELDIVPAYDVKPNKIKSSVDRTPWHVRWIEEKLDSEHCDQVRLLKKFCKEHGLYGSNLKVKGFSGYLCELLIAEYGGFEELAKAAKDWKHGQVIDPEGHFKSEKYLRRKKFKGDALIAIDPVDKDRNVASVLSAENFFFFIKYAYLFTENPSRETFFSEDKKPMGLDELRMEIRDRGTEFLLIEFGAPDVHQDVLFPQLRKMNKRLEKVLDGEGFTVLRKDVWSDKNDCVLLFELEVDELPRVDMRKGPPIHDRRNSEKFINRYGPKHNLMVESGRWYVEYWRDTTHALDFIKDFLQDECEELQEKGIPRHLAEEIGKRIRIASSDDSLRIFFKHPDLRIQMRDYFDKDLV